MPVDATAAWTVGDVVEGSQVREEQAVGEHEPDRALLGLEGAMAVVPHLARDAHVALVEGNHPSEGEHGRRLAAAVGPEHTDDLTGLGREGDIQLDRSSRQANSRIEARLSAVRPSGRGRHRSHLPRRAPSTSTLTARSMMLIEIATWGSRSARRRRAGEGSASGPGSCPRR